MIYFFIDGGALMYPILICSIVGVTFLIDRLIFSIFYIRKLDKPFLKSVNNLIKNSKFQEAAELCKKSSSAYAKHILQLLTKKSQKLPPVINSEVFKHFSSFSKRHKVIESVIAISPLLGILGTVVGIIITFEAMNSGDVMVMQEKIKEITSGIGQALNTTAAGLSVSLICLCGLASFNSFTNKKNEEFIAYFDQLSLDIVKERNKK